VLRTIAYALAASAVVAGCGGAAASLSPNDVEQAFASVGVSTRWTVHARERTAWGAIAQMENRAFLGVMVFDDAHAADNAQEMGFVRAVVGAANGLGAALGPAGIPGWKAGNTHLAALRVRNVFIVYDRSDRGLVARVRAAARKLR
jgi:hypothetical protein